MNGIQFLVFAATVFGAVYFIPRAFAADRLWLTLQNLDDEELLPPSQRTRRQHPRPGQTSRTRANQYLTACITATPASREHPGTRR